MNGCRHGTEYVWWSDNLWSFCSEDSGNWLRVLGMATSVSICWAVLWTLLYILFKGFMNPLNATGLQEHIVLPLFNWWDKEADNFWDRETKLQKKLLKAYDGWREGSAVRAPTTVLPEDCTYIRWLTTASNSSFKGIKAGTPVHMHRAAHICITWK